jgi:hypothetical protein
MMNVALQWLRLLFFIRDAVGSNIGRKPPVLRHYRHIPESLHENNGRYLSDPLSPPSSHSLCHVLRLSPVGTAATVWPTVPAPDGR